ncbi:unnamed protein product, partial [Durusdinium trenchii]
DDVKSRQAVQGAQHVLAADVVEPLNAHQLSSYAGMSYDSRHHLGESLENTCRLPGHTSVPLHVCEKCHSTQCICDDVDERNRSSEQVHMRVTRQLQNFVMSVMEACGGFQIDPENAVLPGTAAIQHIIEHRGGIPKTPKDTPHRQARPGDIFADDGDLLLESPLARLIGSSLLHELMDKKVRVKKQQTRTLPVGDNLYAITFDQDILWCERRRVVTECIKMWVMDIEPEMEMDTLNPKPSGQQP